MAIAIKLRKYLADNGIAYETVSHPHTTSSLDTAHSAHVPEERLAKSVILEDDAGFMMAVVPATEHVKMRKVNHALNRHLGITTENKLKDLFIDCELGAIPAVGTPYSMDTIIDKNFDSYADVYLEAGDHEELLHLSGSSFRKLTKDAFHANIC